MHIAPNRKTLIQGLQVLQQEHEQKNGGNEPGQKIYVVKKGG